MIKKYLILFVVIAGICAACQSPASTPQAITSTIETSAAVTLAPQMDTETPIPTDITQPTSTQPTPMETVTFTTEDGRGVEMTPDIVTVPTGISPNIDGSMSPGEWDGATVENFADGSELLLMYADDFLYLGIRSNTPEMIGANIYIEDSGKIKILHTSAALGTAVYQQGGDSWQRIEGFDWQCRNSSHSAGAQAERANYLLENHWLSANSRMGEPNELEYQIEVTGASQRIAVSVFRSSTPDERAFWPLTLDDDCIKPNPGGLPKELHFSPEQWAILEVSR